jgi:hypothetical protein
MHKALSWNHCSLSPSLKTARSLLLSGITYQIITDRIPTALKKMGAGYLSQTFFSPLVLLFAIFLPFASAAVTVSNTILVFAKDTTSAYSVTSGLTGYGIPYQLVIVPQAGITLPTLNSSTTSGNYGGILMLSEVAYSYSTGWASALTAAQLTQLFTYQTTFGVRMVRLDAFPSADFGMYLTLFINTQQLFFAKL